MSEQLNYQINIGGNATESIGNVKKQLKEANEELIKAQQNFGEYSDEAIQAAKKVAGLRDSIQEARETADLFDPGKKFQALSNTLSAVAGGFAAVQGAIGLFGSESKELEKQLLKVQSALALSQGLSTIADSAKDFQRLGAVIKTQVVTAFTTLRGAIIATGFGALAVGLTLLITNFDKVKKAVLNLVPGLSVVADFVGNLVNKVTDFLGVTSEAGRQTAKLIADNEKAIKEGNRFLELNADKYDEYTQRKIKANLEFKEKQTEFLKDESLAEDERNKLILQAREKANREIVRADQDREANRKKVLDEAAKKNADLQKQRDKEEADRIKAKNDRESAAQKVQIDAFRATLTQREQDILQAEDELEAKRAILIQAGNFDFQKIEEENRIKIAEINAKYDKEAEDKRKAILDKKREDDLKEVERKKEYEEKKRQFELESLELTQQLQDRREQLLLSGLDVLGAIAGENERIANVIFAIQKGLEIAKVVSSASASIGQIIASTQAIPPVLPPGVPNPAYPVAVALGAKRAAIVKVGAAAQIAGIAATGISRFTNGGANISSNVAGQSAVAPLSPQSATTTLSQSTINAIGNSAIRAYVVETDITTNQKRIQAIKQRARFG